ncbi:MAG TPA: serine/threonine-protein kinase [Candidatus Thermoplasmatota archaeon]|nr:serine/threonine-protein kinase [Candidatus Thermoplasmatota archaeon]
MTSYWEVLRFSFTLAGVGLTLTVAGFLAFAPGPTLQRRTLALQFAFMAAWGLAGAANFLLEGYHFELTSWGAFGYDMLALANVAGVLFFWSYPRPPPLRSWHTVVATAVFAWVLAGAVLWIAARGWMFPAGQPIVPRSAWWFEWLVRDGFGATIATMALVASSLLRARDIGGTEERAAPVLVPMVAAGAFVGAGLWLMVIAFSAAGRIDWFFTWYLDDPDICCGLWRLYKEPALYAAFACAAILAVRRKSYAAAAVIAIWAVLFGSGFFEVTRVEYQWVLAGFVPPVGALYAILRYGALGAPRVPAWLQIFLGAAIFVVVFVMTSAFLLSITQDPFIIVMAVLLGAGLGLGSAMYLTGAGRGVFWQAMIPETEETQRRLNAYRAALQNELQNGTDPNDVSTRLRALRTELGISDRDHAVMQHTLQSSTTTAKSGLEPGKLFLNRYRVQKMLGQGGAATTYLCRDERVGRDVVVKSLRTPPSARDGPRSVVREARAIGNLNHPNVVTFHDIEQVGDEAFIVMEHMPGGSLAKRLEHGPLTPDEFQRLGDDLLQALEAVHAAGLVHRDVKPSNILFTSDGRAKLADFGIAHLPGFETTVAGYDASAAVGTIRFMSPEQALGHHVTHRSDLYSAAATLYEALTGKPYLAPNPGESAVELQMRAAMAPGFDRPTGDAALDAWFGQALRRDADQRFQDARSMREGLARAMSGRAMGRAPDDSSTRRPAPA